MSQGDTGIGDLAALGNKGNLGSDPCSSRSGMCSRQEKDHQVTGMMLGKTSSPDGRSEHLSFYLTSVLLWWWGGRSRVLERYFFYSMGTLKICIFLPQNL